MCLTDSREYSQLRSAVCRTVGRPKYWAMLRLAVALATEDLAG